MKVAYTLSDTLVDTGLITVQAVTLVHSPDGEPPFYIRQQFVRKLTGADPVPMMPGDAILKKPGCVPCIAEYTDLAAAREVAIAMHEMFIPIAIKDLLVGVITGEYT